MSFFSLKVSKEEARRNAKCFVLIAFLFSCIVGIYNYIRCSGEDICYKTSENLILTFAVTLLFLSLVSTLRDRVSSLRVKKAIDIWVVLTLFWAFFCYTQAFDARQTYRLANSYVNISTFSCKSEYFKDLCKPDDHLKKTLEKERAKASLEIAKYNKLMAVPPLIVFIVGLLIILVLKVGKKYPEESM